MDLSVPALLRSFHSRESSRNGCGWTCPSTNLAARVDSSLRVQNDDLTMFWENLAAEATATDQRGRGAGQRWRALAGVSQRSRTQSHHGRLGYPSTRVSSNFFGGWSCDNLFHGLLLPVVASPRWLLLASAKRPAARCFALPAVSAAGYGPQAANCRAAACRSRRRATGVTGVVPFSLLFPLCLRSRFSSCTPVLAMRWPWSQHPELSGAGGAGRPRRPRCLVPPALWCVW